MSLGHAIKDLQYIGRIDLATSDSQISNRRNAILNHGTVQCPTSKVMLLGDSGAGKTSTSRHLLGKSHIESHLPTMGIEASVVEWTHVDHAWNEVDQENAESELERAVAYCLIHPSKDDDMVHSINTGKRKEKQNRFALFILIIQMSLTVVASLLLPFCWRLPSDFSLLLIIITGVHVIMDKNSKDDAFTCSYGLSILIVEIFFWQHTTFSSTMMRLINDEEASGNSIFVSSLYLVISCGLVCFIIGFVLSPGGGYGMSFFLCFIDLNEGIAADVVGMNDFLIRAVCTSTHVISVFLFVWLSRKRKTRAILCYSLSLIVVTVTVMSIIKNHFCRYFTLFMFYALCGSLVTASFLEAHRLCRILMLRFKFVPYQNMTVTSIVGFISGILYTFSNDCQFISFDLLSVTITLLGCSLPVYFRWYQYQNVNRFRLPYLDMMQQLQDGKDQWPTVLSLMDCAGHAVYHHAHHIFMARHASYLVIFRLTHLCDDMDNTVCRIIYWSNSVLAHSRHPHSRIILVATHTMSVTDVRQREEAVRLLSARLPMTIRSRIVKSAEGRLVFLIDNHHRSSCAQDVTQLKMCIWRSSTNAIYVRTPNRTSWFAFIDFVRQRRREDASLSDTLIDTEELWHLVHERCCLEKRSDFFRMLQFFHDRGDIFFDAEDRVMRRFVFLDVRVLAEAVRLLIPSQLDPASLTAMTMVSSLELEQRLKCPHGGAKNEVILSLMEALGLILPLHDKFLLLHSLPQRDISKAMLNEPDEEAEFYFDAFPPYPVFLRLLSQCYALTPPHKRRQCLIFSSEALFFTSDVVYTLRSKPNSQANLLSVQMKDVRGKGGGTRVWEHLRCLDCMVWTVCCKYFESVEYCLSVICPCSKERQSARKTTEHKLTILDRRRGRQQFGYEFPTKHLTFPCVTLDRAVTLSFEIQDDRHDIEIEWKESSTFDTVVVDAFISCHENDRYFVQKNLLPIMERPPHHLRKTEGGDRRLDAGVSLMVNYYDNPSPAVQFGMPKSLVERCMRRSKSVIAILSRHFLTCSHCCHEVEMAVSMKKKVIPVRLDSSLPTHDLLADIAVIDFPDDENEESMLDFYTRLLRSVKY